MKEHGHRIAGVCVYDVGQPFSPGEEICVVLGPRRAGQSRTGREKTPRKKRGNNEKVSFIVCNSI